MYWLDTLLLALLALGGALGFFSGFLWQIARILTLGISLLATVACNDAASRFCQEHLLREADPRISQAVAYVAVFLGVYVVLFLATRLLHQGIRASDLEFMDRLLGGLFGAGKMALILGASCLAAANYPHALTRSWMSKSTLAPTFADGMEHVLIIIPDEYKENLRATLVSLRDVLNRPAAEPQPDEKSKAENHVS
jgi:membrane protein required for colicin V production